MSCSRCSLHVDISPDMATVDNNAGVFAREKVAASREKDADDVLTSLSDNLDKRKNLEGMSSEEAAEHIKQMDKLRQRNSQRQLNGLIEELADWVAQTLGLPNDTYKPDNDATLADKFFGSFQTGLLLARLIEKCTPPDANLTYKFKENAQAGTFMARDNVFHFIESCQKLGILEVNLFETEDLVLRKNERKVCNCLLGLARVGVRAGVKPPLVVQYELEIEAMGDDDDDSAGPVAVVERKGKYKPDKNDDIDVALAKEMEELGLDLPIQKLPGTKGIYTVGDDPKKIHVRVVRGNVMVRVGGGWVDLLTFSTRKLVKRSPASPNTKGLLYSAQAKGKDGPEIAVTTTTTTTAGGKEVKESSTQKLKVEGAVEKRATVSPGTSPASSPRGSKIPLRPSSSLTNLNAKENTSTTSNSVAAIALADGGGTGGGGRTSSAANANGGNAVGESTAAVVTAGSKPKPLMKYNSDVGQPSTSPASSPKGGKGSGIPTLGSPKSSTATAANANAAAKSDSKIPSPKAAATKSGIPTKTASPASSPKAGAGAGTGAGATAAATASKLKQPTAVSGKSGIPTAAGSNVTAAKKAPTTTAQGANAAEKEEEDKGEEVELQQIQTEKQTQTQTQSQTQSEQTQERKQTAQTQAPPAQQPEKAKAGGGGCCILL